MFYFSNARSFPLIVFSLLERFGIFLCPRYIAAPGWEVGNPVAGQRLSFCPARPSLCSFPSGCGGHIVFELLLMDQCCFFLTQTFATPHCKTKASECLRISFMIFTFAYKYDLTFMFYFGMPSYV